VLVRVTRHIMHIEADVAFGELPATLASIVRPRSTTLLDITNNRLIYQITCLVDSNAVWTAATAQIKE
jgi:hypothetical protein